MSPIPRPPPTDDPLGLDRAVFQRMLSLGGDGLRPALLAQLLEDFARLDRALEAPDLATLERTAHELKGLAATIGARALAEQAARFDLLAGGATPAVRGAMVLGLRRLIDRMCAELHAQRQNTSAA